jgi:hypothetical protein
VSKFVGAEGSACFNDDQSDRYKVDGRVDGMPSGRLAEKVAFSVPDKRPSMPAITDLPASAADLAHLIFVAVPVSPEFRVC